MNYCSSRLHQVSQLILVQQQPNALVLPYHHLGLRTTSQNMRRRKKPFSLLQTLLTGAIKPILNARFPHQRSFLNDYCTLARLRVKYALSNQAQRNTMQNMSL